MAYLIVASDTERVDGVVGKIKGAQSRAGLREIRGDRAAADTGVAEDDIVVLSVE